MRRALIVSCALLLSAAACGEPQDPPASAVDGSESTSCGGACGASSSAQPDPTLGTTASPESTGGESSDGTTGATTESGDETGGVVTYDPCPVDVPCRYMPLGDSITEGYEGGYRIPLFRSVLAAGKTITFVGSNANGPDEVDGVSFPREHEGHSGYYIDATHSQYNLDDLVDDAIATHQPHIIALMVGANDVVREGFPDSAERLELFVDHLLAIAPDALLVLAQNTPTQSDEDNVRVQDYIAAMPEIVEARAAEGKHIILVDMYTAFTADPDYKINLMYDNIHPGAAGDEVMASVWFAAIEPVLK